MNITATYSPDDNKIRLRADERLPSDLFARVKATGYKWAPRQELFVAPMWTPNRAALAVELAGFIGDEDSTLVERSADRAERFEEYSERRFAEGEREAASVDGAPSVVASNNPCKAEKEAQRIENTQKRALRLFKTSEYWAARAAGAIRHAKYVERADVRARRIKKIEADKRKQERTIKDSECTLKLWSVKYQGVRENALIITGNYSAVSCSKCFTLAEYPRDPPASQYEGAMGLYSALTGDVITADQARELSETSARLTIERCGLWVAHYDNRLLYEKAMLGSQGGSDLLKPKARPKQLPLVNYRKPEGFTIENQYSRGSVIHYKQVEMTKAEYKKIYHEQRGTRTLENSHRMRVAILRGTTGDYSRTDVCVFLTDSKEHKKPEPVTIEAPKPTQEDVAAATERSERGQQARTPSPAQERIGALKDSIETGVTVAVAPHLFPTPREIGERMAELLGVVSGDAVLEPSAGTGMLLDTLGGSMFGHNPETGSVTAVEINQALANTLERDFPQTRVLTGDFLKFDFPQGFDKIIMNPPFNNGEDIKHIDKAYRLLHSGGRLVALCAAGPRQQRFFENSADHWEVLPPGSFKASGTNVNVALVVLSK